MAVSEFNVTKWGATKKKAVECLTWLPPPTANKKKSCINPNDWVGKGGRFLVIATTPPPPTATNVKTNFSQGGANVIFAFLRGQKV